MAEEMSEPRRSSRDRGELARRLSGWLAERVGAPVTVEGLASPEGTGMSSETLMFDATWDGEAGRERRALVARVAPDLSDVPVFPTYDLDLQYRVMGLVGARTGVPVPTTRWFEADPTVLGAPFFVMDRVDGRAAPDVPPYVFEGWILDASPEERARLQDAAVGVLAGVHSVEVGPDTAFLELDAPGDTPLRRHVNHWKAYRDWVCGEREHPLIEAGIEWLEAHWPTETPAVVSWGDSRIGNILWSGVDPVAVVDWEMAAVAPRELDIAWMTFLHTFFQDLAERLGLEGLPGFMRAEDVAATYAERTGVAPVDLDWFETYAAWRHAIIMTRIHARQVRFGEAERSDDTDAPVLHRERLARMISD